MTVEPATRRANFWLFLGLVVFALALCALVLVWMRARTRAQGGAVYPPVSFFCHPERRPQAVVEGPFTVDPLFALEGPSTSLRFAQDDRSFEFTG